MVKTATSVIGSPNVTRLQELDRVNAEWGANALREFHEANADPESWFTTPMFLEIVAERNS